MAPTFTVVTSYDDVEFLGGTETRAVIVTGVQTKPSGIYLEVRNSKTDVAQLGPDIIGALAASITTIYEGLAAETHVSSVQWGQQEIHGQLQDIAFVTVTSASGNSSTTLTIPLSDIGPGGEAALIASTSARLDAIEHL